MPRPLDELFAVAEKIEFRLSARDRWRPGRVVAVAAETMTVSPPRSGVLFSLAPTAGRGGVRKPRLRGAGDRAERRRAPRALEPAPVRLSPGTGELRLVHRGAAELRPDPMPRPRARCADFLDFVRPRACCACGAPGPSDAHHIGPRGVGQKADDFGAVPLCRGCHRVVTDTHRLPGLDAQQTDILILRASVEVLVEWAIQREAGVPVEVHDEAVHLSPAAPARELLCARAGASDEDVRAQHEALKVCPEDWGNPALVGARQPQFFGGKLAGEHGECRGCGTHLYRPEPPKMRPAVQVPGMIACDTSDGGAA